MTKKDERAVAEQVDNAPDGEQGTIAGQDVTGLPPHSHQDDVIPESGGTPDGGEGEGEGTPEADTKSKSKK